MDAQEPRADDQAMSNAMLAGMSLELLISMRDQLNREIGRRNKAARLKKQSARQGCQEQP